MFNNFFLQSLKEGEEAIAIVHKHWVKLAPAILRAVIAGIIPSFFIKFILSSQTATFIYLAFLGVLVLYVAYSWIVYYFDVFIITDQRVIDIQQTGIFQRSVAEAPMNRIQDVTYAVGGFFATLFNYGKVTVRTASNNELTMKDVSNPEEIQEIIVELQKLHQGDKKLSAEELLAYIANLKNVQHDQDEDEPEDEDSVDDINEDDGEE